jgi:hypothetical protein
MTRAGLIHLISLRLKCSRTRAAELVDLIYEEMETDLLQGKPLRLAGIATLRVRAAAARRNLIQAAGGASGNAEAHADSTSANGMDVEIETTKASRIPRYRLTLRPSTAFRQRLAMLNAAVPDMSSAPETHPSREGLNEGPNEVEPVQPQLDPTSSSTPQPAIAGLEST